MPLGRWKPEEVAAPANAYPKLKGGPGMSDDEYIEIEAHIPWGVRQDAESDGRIRKKGVNAKDFQAMTAEERMKASRWSFAAYQKTFLTGMVRRLHIRDADDESLWMDADGLVLEEVLDSLKNTEKDQEGTNFLDWLFGAIGREVGGTRTEDLTVSITAGGKRKKATFPEATT